MLHFSPDSFLSLLHDKKRVPKNVKGTGAWDRSLSEACTRHALIIPLGDVNCAICELRIPVVGSRFLLESLWAPPGMMVPPPRSARPTVYLHDYF